MLLLSHSSPRSCSSGGAGYERQCCGQSRAIESRHERLLERAGDQHVGRQRGPPPDVHEHFKRGQRSAAGGEHHRRAGDSSGHLRGAPLAIEGVGRVPCLDDAPRRRPLREDAVFEPVDESFDLAGADIGSGEIEWRGAAERRLRGREPVGGAPVRSPSNSSSVRPKSLRGPQQPVGFVRQEATLALAAGQRAARNVDPLEQGSNGRPVLRWNRSNVRYRKPLPTVLRRSWAANVSSPSSTT